MGRVQRQMQYYEKYLKNSATEVEKFSFREGVYLRVESKGKCNITKND